MRRLITAIALYRDNALRLSWRAAWRLSGDLAKELTCSRSHR